jgi:hypothetical protein
MSKQNTWMSVCVRDIVKRHVHTMEIANFSGVALCFWGYDVYDLPFLYIKFTLVLVLLPSVWRNCQVKMKGA